MTAPTNGAAEVLPWPSDVELEIRGLIGELEQQQLRTARLVTALQLEGRQLHRETMARIDAMGGKLDELVTLVKRSMSNGHGADEPMGGTSV